MQKQFCTCFLLCRQRQVEAFLQQYDNEHTWDQIAEDEHGLLRVVRMVACKHRPCTHSAAPPLSAHTALTIARCSLHHHCLHAGPDCGAACKAAAHPVVSGTECTHPQGYDTLSAAGEFTSIMMLLQNYQGCLPVAGLLPQCFERLDQFRIY